MSSSPVGEQPPMQAVAGASLRPDTDHAAIADGHHLARGAAANALVLIAANFRGVFTFLIARILGEAGLGRFSLAFATVDVLSKIATLGLDTALVPLVARREAAGDRAGTRLLFIQALFVGAVASVLLLTLAWPALTWIAHVRHLDEFSRGGAIMLLALPGIALARISTGASRGLMSMRSEFYSRGLAETWMTTGVFAVAVAIGVRDAAPALAVATGSLGGAVVAIVLAARTIAASPPTQGRGVSAGTPPTLSEMVRFALPVSGSGLLNALALRVDVLLLGAFVGRAPGVTLESFGVFCAATEVAGGLRKIRQVFDPIFAPVAAVRHISTPDALRATVAGPGRWVLAGQLPLIGVLILSGGTVLSIYGSGFRAGGTWVALLACAHAANSFAGLVETLLIMERPALNLMNATVTVSVQFLAGLALIPHYGVMGAVIAMGLGFAAQGALRFVELKHVFGWGWPWRSLARPLAAFTIAFAPSVAVRVLGGQGVEIAAGILFLLAYAGAWRWLGADPADRAVWLRLLNRD